VSVMSRRTKRTTEAEEDAKNGIDSFLPHSGSALIRISGLIQYFLM